MTTTMLAATLFAAKDLCLIEVPLGPVPADQVRLRFRAGGAGSAARTCTTTSTAAAARSS